LKNPRDQRNSNKQRYILQVSEEARAEIFSGSSKKLRLPQLHEVPGVKSCTNARLHVKALPAKRMKKDISTMRYPLACSDLVFFACIKKSLSSPTS
jgi:transposase